MKTDKDTLQTKNIIFPQSSTAYEDKQDCLCLNIFTYFSFTFYCTLFYPIFYVCVVIRPEYFIRLCVIQSIMSVKAKKQYNLRSNKGTSIPVPVELQVSDDTRFLNSILENSILSQQTQDDSSDSDHSVNLNSIDSAHSSDDNEQVPCSSERSSRSFDKFHTEKDQSTSDSVTGNQTNRLDIQSVINVQILTQPDNLGKRLEKIEGKKCKKTSDRSKIKKSQKTTDTVMEISRLRVNPPQSSVSSTTIVSMRQDAILQAKVDERLQELSELAKTGTFQN